MLADYHVHTCFSDDSQCPMEEMVQTGIKIGLNEIAFTEHVDYGVKTDLNCQYRPYFQKLGEMQRIYGSQITIRKGIEFGVQSETVTQFERDFQQYPFDFVILSNHQVGNREFWTYEFQQGKARAEFHRAYYEAIYDVMTRYTDYSVLGHLDMIQRYDKEGYYPIEHNLPVIEAILKRAIQDGKGIEVNTSCYRYRLADLTPERRILELYHDLGGQIITIGSDAHTSDYLGDHIGETQQILKEIGFRYICRFEAMRPIFEPLT